MTEIMAQALEDATPSTSRKADPETLVLRARPARAIRFKRGVIVSLAAIAVAGVLGTAWFALEPRALHLAADGEDKNIAAKAPADALSALPASHGTVPKLGPPLPGDLGKPILDRQRHLAGGAMPPVPSAASTAQQVADDARQRRAAELKAGRESGLLVQTTGQHDLGQAMPAGVVPAPVVAGDQAGKVAIDADRDPNGQERKAEFVRTTDKAGVMLRLRAEHLGLDYTSIAAAAVTGAPCLIFFMQIVVEKRLTPGSIHRSSLSNLSSRSTSEVMTWRR